MLCFAHATPGVDAQDACRPDAAEAACFAGTFNHARVAKEERARIASIEAATEDMIILGRGIARRRITSGTRPPPSYTFLVTDEEITIVTDVRWTTRKDGAPKRVRDGNGDTYWTSTRVAAGRLVQRVWDDELDNENAFALSPDGQTLTMSVTIKHDRIPGTIAYRVTYRRKGHEPTRQ